MNLLIVLYIALAIVGLTAFPEVRYWLAYAVGYCHGFIVGLSRRLRGRRS